MALIFSPCALCTREDLNINRIEDIWVDAQDLLSGMMFKQPYWS